MKNKSTYPEEAHGFQARRADRVDLEGETASLNPDQVYAVEISIENLSSSGFMAECPAPVLIGSYVSLDVPGIGRVEAQVRWQIGGKMGGMFLDPISLARCEWTAVKATAA
jgi:PilZ domain